MRRAASRRPPGVSSSRITAAAPVSGTGEAADEKVVAAVRSAFRATAEARGRDPRVAEAMVDPAVEVEGLVARGQLLSLSASEAQRWGYADGLAASRADLLSALGLAGATVLETSPGPAESLVRFLTTPVVASLLISLGLLLIWADVASGGLGLLTLAGVGLLAAFFWGHALAGLAGWEGVALVALGLVLLAAEVLLIPGFGVAGVLGSVALVAGLFLSLISGEVVTTEALARAAGIVGMALLAAGGGGVLLLRFVPARRLVPGLVLDARVAGAGLPALWRPAASTDAGSLLGAEGVALSALRPAGFARIGGARVDVVTRGEYVAAGEPVEVVADEGYRRVVRPRRVARRVRAEGVE